MASVEYLAPGPDARRWLGCSCSCRCRLGASATSSRASTISPPASSISTSRRLESELLRHADLPSLMSVNPDVDALLAQAGRPLMAVREKASRALTNVAVRAGTREIYVIDRADTVLAASDWYAPYSLYGNTLSGISCAAVTSGRARGFLFNPKTAAPEYYFVHAIGVSVAEPRRARKPVWVVKISLSPMESTWVDFSFRPDSEKIMVLDEHDVVILSSVPRWRYRTTTVFQAGRSVSRGDKAPNYPTGVTPLQVTGALQIGRGAQLVSLPGPGCRTTGPVHCP